MSDGVYRFDDNTVKKIARTVRRVERTLGNDLDTPGNRNYVSLPYVVGELTSDLSRGSWDSPETATFKPYFPVTPSGEDSDPTDPWEKETDAAGDDIELDIIDIGMLSSDVEPLTSGTVVGAACIGGR